MFRDALVDKLCSVGLGQTQTSGQFQVAGNNNNNSKNNSSNNNNVGLGDQ